MSKTQYSNSLIDCVVLAGCDNYTGLTANNSQFTETDTFHDRLFNSSYEAKILSVVSYDTAYYPATSYKFNQAYPFAYMQEEPAKTPTMPPTESIEASFKRISTRRATISPLELPIQAEVEQNLPQFCFPSKIQISKSCLEPSIHSFILTDLVGRRKYAVVLTFYREFYCCEGNDSEFRLIQIDDDEDEMEDKKDYVDVFVPTAIVMISKYSYYNLIRDCLSSAYTSVIKNMPELRVILEQYAYQLTRIPVPPISTQRFNLRLEYNLPFKSITIHPPDEYGYEAFDLNLATLFFLFDVDNLLKIVLAILTESKLLFLSENNGLLTPIIHCFMKLIQPFKWSLPYVPLLPSALIEYIEAPQPFVMGFNSSYRNLIVDNSHGVIFIDIDHNKVIMPDSIQLVEFPKSHLINLKIKLSDINFNKLQIRYLTNPSKTDLKAREDEETQLIKELNSQVINAFFEFFVDLFGDLYNYVKIQNKFFNKKKYLESLSADDLPFYKQVIETSLFDMFVIDLIKKLGEDKKDIFYEKFLSMKNSMSSASGGTILAALIKNAQRSRTQSTSNNYSKPITKTLLIKSPHVKENIDALTKEIESSQILLYKDSLLYMRGFLKFMSGILLEGAIDLYKIESNEIFPKQTLIDEIIPTLNASQRDVLFSQPFYKSAPDYRKIVREEKNQFLSFSSSIDLIEKEYDHLDSISFNDFRKRLSIHEIRIDADVVERLFKSLTLEESSDLDVATMELFLDNYQLKEDSMEIINKFLPSNRVRAIEFPIKLSDGVAVPKFGLGRVVLTQKCLYFIELGTNRRKLITELVHIKMVENTQYSHSLFNSKRALKIGIHDKEDIYLCFEKEVTIWFILITELCNALYISKELKDTSVIQYAANNAFILDSVYLSGLDPSAFHNKDLDKSLRYLTYYTQLRENKARCSTETKHILSMRIKPFSREYNTQSVESMIYVDIDNYPTIWCAIGNRIRILDAITWHDEATDLSINDKITCLLHDEKQNKVWIGTIDKCIYVTDVLTRTFTTKIVEHSDVVVSIAHFTKNNWILSGSSSGEILVWDAVKLEKQDVFKLNEESMGCKKQLVCILSTDVYLIFVLLDQIEIYDENFTRKEKLCFQVQKDDKNEKFSCACVTRSQVESEQQLWAGNSRNGLVYVWSLLDFQIKMRVGVDDCLGGYRSFLAVNDLIWAGSKDGKLSVFDVKTYECEKSFDAHTDTVRSLCYVNNSKSVVSGSGSKDGTIAVWRAAAITKKTIMNSMKKMLAVQTDNY